MSDSEEDLEKVFLSYLDASNPKCAFMYCDATTGRTFAPQEAVLEVRAGPFLANMHPPCATRFIQQALSRINHHSN